MSNLDYWQRLQSSEMYTLERRREHYLIIHTWKIVNGKTPNFKDAEYRVNVHINDRTEIKCGTPAMSSRGPCFEK